VSCCRERHGGGPSPPVSLFVGLFSVHNFGAQVSRRPHDQAGNRDLNFVGCLRNTKVDYHGLAVHDHHVCWFEITVNNTGVVNGCQRVQKCVAKVDEFVFCERTVFTYVIGKREAVDEFGHHIRGIGFEFRIEDCGNAWVLDASKGSHLSR